MNEKPEIEVGKLPVITKFIYTLGVLPTSYLMSMTYQEQVTWLYNYIQTEVIPLLNTESGAIQELQTLYELLRTYVNDYFDNLDVQEEINKKLDEMMEDGTLAQIINNLFTEFEQSINNEVNNFETSVNNEVNNFKTSVNNTVSNIETQVRSIESGAPIPVSSTSNMTDTTKIYVNTTDGKWYYYNGTNWTIGGTYQSTGIGIGEIKLNNLENALQNGILSYNGVSGAIRTTGGIYTGAVGSTVQLTTLSSFRCGELSVSTGDLVAVPFVVYSTDYGNNFPIIIVDSNNKILENHSLSEFLETVDNRSLPKQNVILTMPANAYKVLFNERINENTLPITTPNPIWVPVKITSYNYCDKRLDNLLTGKELLVSTNTSKELKSLLTWELDLSDYYSNEYSVEPLEKIYIENTLPEVAYMCVALFTDENDNVIGYLRPAGTNVSQEIAGSYIVPAFAKKMYVCYRLSNGTPKVYKMIMGEDSTEIDRDMIHVELIGNTLSLTKNRTNVTFDNYGGNNLFMIKSYTVNGSTKTLYTDMTPAPYIVEAINNIDGDRTEEGFTGGNHQWNNQGSGSTATAEEISKKIYCDNQEFIAGDTYCNIVKIVTINRVQATNTCLEAGGGRNVLEEKITFEFDGESIKVNTEITPLETIKIKRYYGMQLVKSSSFKYYENKIYSSIVSLTKKPNAIITENIGMKLNNGGLGDYLYNNNHYATEYQTKSYYTPIYDNNSNFTVNDKLWLSGEYILGINKII